MELLPLAATNHQPLNPHSSYRVFLGSARSSLSPVLNHIILKCLPFTRERECHTHMRSLTRPDLDRYRRLVLRNNISFMLMLSPITGNYTSCARRLLLPRVFLSEFVMREESTRSTYAYSQSRSRQKTRSGERKQMFLSAKHPFLFPL